MYMVVKTLVASVAVIILRQLGLVCKSSDNRLLMYIATLLPPTNDSVSAAIVERNFNS